MFCNNSIPDDPRSSWNLYVTSEMYINLIIMIFGGNIVIVDVSISLKISKLLENEDKYFLLSIPNK